MELRDYRFKSRTELANTAFSVLNFYKENINPKEIDYSSLILYKVGQLDKFLGDRYDITPEDLMMYLTCPVGVDKIDDKTTFGIRTNSGSGNGNLNRSLSKVILFSSMDSAGVSDQDIEKIFDFQIDQPTTLYTNDDYRDLYAPSMLEDVDLLYYLFLTGRGEEFTKIYGDVEFLKKLESGTFKGEEVIDKLPSVTQGKRPASKDLMKFYVEDLRKIDEINKKEQSQSFSKTLA